MSKVNELFNKELNIVNFGIESFYQDQVKQNHPAVHVDWKPIAGGDKKTIQCLRKLKEPKLFEKITEANKEALSRILAAQPVLVGMTTAGEALEGMTPTTILHAGPPVTWENMCGPVRGAVMGGLIYEGLAKDLKEAEELAASGKITFAPCHHFNAVGPMAGIITYSMPVWHVVNKTFGTEAYCTMNEGLGKVLRFGACDQEVFDRLVRMRDEYYPVYKEALELHGEIDMKVMIAQALQMGDECHNRNKAGTSLFLREIAQDIFNTHFSKEQQMAAFKFLNDNDHTFLNLSMPACKCTMDAIFDIPYSTVVATMCRNGTEFGIRIAGLGKDHWFTAPSEFVYSALRVYPRPLLPWIFREGRQPGCGRQLYYGDNRNRRLLHGGFPCHRPVCRRTGAGCHQLFHPDV